MLTVPLSEDMLDLLSRPVEGSGGFQDTLTLLQSRVQGSSVSLSREEARRVVRYVQEYGGGGFQERLRPLAERLEALLSEGA